MKKFIVIFLTLTIFLMPNSVASASIATTKEHNKTITQEIQIKSQNSKFYFFIPFFNNLWKYWNNHETNHSHKHMPTPTPYPTIKPTIVPTKIPTPTATLTPTPTMTITPTATPTPEKSNTLPVTYFNIPSGGQGLQIVKGPDGNIWFTVDRTGPNAYLYPQNVVLEKAVIGSVAKITTSGQITEYYLPSSSNLPISTDVGEFMFNLTSGPDGNIWYTQPNAGIIGKVKPSDGTITEYNLSTKQYAPRQVTTGPDGNMWFTDLKNGLVSMDTQGNILNHIPTVYGVTMITGPDNDIWVGGSTDSITKVATDGSHTTFSTPARAVYMINGIHNDLWFSQNGGFLSNITTDGKETIYQTIGIQAWDIAMDTSNNIWYTNSLSDNKIFELNPTTGTILSYLLSSTASYVVANDMVVGPDGNIWFTSNGQIGRIDISKTTETVSTPIVPTIINQ